MLVIARSRCCRGGAARCWVQRSSAAGVQRGWSVDGPWLDGGCRGSGQRMLRESGRWSESLASMMYQGRHGQQVDAAGDVVN
jgi:hypothetical protein